MYAPSCDSISIQSLPFLLVELKQEEGNEAERKCLRWTLWSELSESVGFSLPNRRKELYVASISKSRCAIRQYCSFITSRHRYVTYFLLFIFTGAPITICPRFRFSPRPHLWREKKVLDIDVFLNFMTSLCGTTKMSCIYNRFIGVSRLNFTVVWSCTHLKARSTFRWEIALKAGI